MDPQKANGLIVSAVQTVEWIWKASAGPLAIERGLMMMDMMDGLTLR